MKEIGLVNQIMNIIEQTQLNNDDPIKSSFSLQNWRSRLELNFGHPVKYFAFVITNLIQTSLSNNSGGTKNFTSLFCNMFGNDGNDGTVEFLLNGIEREIKLPISYYTRVFPKKYCDKIPELDRIGFYSFAIKPFDNEPSGICNFSKILDRNIKIKFANNDVTKIAGKNLYVFAVNYNILVITNGMAVVRYR